ncbi:hypothetical protein [Nocardia sp. NPDC051832]|uniref:YncE family protein n=1 Tax=Nocardia sp. NPDC051832 TaxID=3155673 RepID=UPI003439769D
MSTQAIPCKLVICTTGDNSLTILDTTVLTKSLDTVPSTSEVAAASTIISGLGAPTSVTCSRLGNFVAVGCVDSRKVVVVDVEKGKVEVEIDLGDKIRPDAVAAGPDLKVIAVADSEAEDLLFVTPSSSLYRERRAYGKSPVSLAVLAPEWDSAGAKKQRAVVVASAATATVACFDVSTNQEIWNDGGRADTAPRAMAFTSDDRVEFPILAMVYPDRNVVAVLDPADGTFLFEVAVGARPVAVAICRRQSEVWVVNADDNTVTVVDLVTRSATRTFPVGASPAGIVFDYEDRWAYVTNSGDNTLSMILVTRAPNVHAVVPVGNRPTGIATAIVPTSKEEEEEAPAFD